MINNFLIDNFTQDIPKTLLSNKLLFTLYLKKVNNVKII